MKKILAWACALALSAGLMAPSFVHADEDHDDDVVEQFGGENRKPRFLSDKINTLCYDGVADDLLTGGLGKAGLATLAAPAFANPLAPTPAELRRNAIYTNYRAVLDISAAGGYGTIYGPNVIAEGVPGPGEGKIAGCEHIAYADNGTGLKNVVLMVQIPAHFDPANPCIVSATASGSRGIYGAIGASGEWGLKKGCAVAYTDKGTGNGLHDLQADTVHLIDGTRTAASAAGKASHFTAALTEAQRNAFNAATPDRVAYKHAHSQQNPERDWGRNTLQAIRFAFYLLNEQYGSARTGGGRRVTIDRENTLVIASGISNGGTGALAAGEQDRLGLVDGVVANEPNAQPDDVERLRIVQGDKEMPTIGRPLLDYFTFANIYQPCAALAADAQGGPGLPAFFLFNIPNPAGGANRCAALAAKGLVAGSGLAEQAADALAKLRAYGWLPESDRLHASHYRLASNAIAVTYSNAHGRFSVLSNVCGFSFASTGPLGDPIPQLLAPQLASFSTGNGVPPTSGVNIVYNDAANSVVSGAGKLDLLAASPSSGLADFALDGALCHRSLVTGRDAVTGERLTGEMAAMSARVHHGIREVQLTGRLRGKPTIIVHGRSDALVPVNHASRAYVARHLDREGRSGRGDFTYVEVTNAQHFDAFLPASPFLPGYDAAYVPLHVYFFRAMDLMYEHLRFGRALPPSQVVRGVPRGVVAGMVPPLALANLPPILDAPASGDRIVFRRNTLFVPD